MDYLFVPCGYPNSIQTQNTKEVKLKLTSFLHSIDLEKCRGMQNRLLWNPIKNSFQIFHLHDSPNYIIVIPEKPVGPLVGDGEDIKKWPLAE